MIRFVDTRDQHLSDKFGFRKGKPTTDAFESISDMVLEGSENWQHTAGVFLCLSKAFDCVDHKTLDKLNSHGVRGIPHQWLEYILSDRSQIVNISNKFSDFIKLRYGVL